MLLSIIIPIYNSEKYLEDCLSSLLSQTEKNFEVICINDGSVDSSLSVLNSYKDSFEFFEIISKNNEGQSVARNKGLEIASGEYVLFLDSDDLLVSNAVEVLCRVIKEKEVDIIFFEASSFYDEFENKIFNESSYLRPVFNESEQVSSEVFFIQSMEQGKYTVSPCCYTFKRDAYSSVKFEAGIIHEDNLFTTRLILHNLNARIKCLNEPLFIRRVRPDSTMTEVKSLKHVDGYLKCAYELEVLISKNNYNPLLKKNLSYFIQRLYGSAMYSKWKVRTGGYSYMMNLKCCMKVLRLPVISPKWVVLTLIPFMPDLKKIIVGKK